MSRIGLAVALLMPGMALAQPSFDCAKASTPIERAICNNAKLSKADRELATVYGALAGKLAGVAKEHLLKDQLNWLSSRAKACTGESEAVTRCLGNRYEQRIATLRAAGEGGYPYVSEQSLLKTGKVKAIRYEIDARYPQFDGNADFSTINKAFATAAAEGAKNATPGNDADVGREQMWTYEQGFELFRPGPNAVTVQVTSYVFTGGAHGSTNISATLVDLHSGTSVPPSEVFLPDAPWLTAVTDMARADLKKQFAERPGFEESLEPKQFDKMMKEPERYLFKAGVLDLIFNQYEVGPYAAGLYTVTIPYARLARLLRPDGLVQLAPVGDGRGGR